MSPSQRPDICQPPFPKGNRLQDIDSVRQPVLWRKNILAGQPSGKDYTGSEMRKKLQQNNFPLPICRSVRQIGHVEIYPDEYIQYEIELRGSELDDFLRGMVAHQFPGFIWLPGDPNAITSPIVKSIVRPVQRSGQGPGPSPSTPPRPIRAPKMSALKKSSQYPISPPRPPNGRRDQFRLTGSEGRNGQSTGRSDHMKSTGLNQQNSEDGQPLGDVKLSNGNGNGTAGAVRKRKSVSWGANRIHVVPAPGEVE